MTTRHSATPIIDRLTGHAARTEARPLASQIADKKEREMLLRHLSAFVLGAVLLASAASRAGTAHAGGPCADPSGSCPNGGQVTFTPGGGATAGCATGPCADPNNNCPNGGQVTFTPGGDTSTNQPTPQQPGGQPTSRNQPSQPQPSNQPSQASAANPTSLTGHYQCSSEVLIGFGGQPCTYEPVLALNDDGTYQWGSEQGTYTYDGTNVTFSGSLGSGTVQSRLLVIDSQTTDPTTGAAMTTRYRYIRMDY